MKAQSLTVTAIGYNVRSQDSFVTALSKVLMLQYQASLVTYEDYLQAVEGNEGWRRWESSPHLEYDTERRHYTLHYYADYNRAAKHLILGGGYLFPLPLQMQGLILLVNAREGLLSQAHSYLALLSRIQTCRLVIWLDLEEDIGARELSQVEEALLTQLSPYCKSERDIHIICGSLAEILNSMARDLNTQDYSNMRSLLQTLDGILKPAVSRAEQPFLLPVEEVFVKDGKVLVTGRVRRGKGRVGEYMELIRHTGKREQVLITGMRTFKKVLESATVGDNVGCALEGVNQSLIERGAVLVAPGSMTLSTTLQGAVYLHLLEEAGANTSLQDGQKVQCFIWTRYVVGTIKMPQEREPLQPGNWGYVKLELAEETALEIGSSFTLHNLRFGTIGTCLVVGLEASIPHQ